jgi:hypothetical protein
LAIQSTTAKTESNTLTQPTPADQKTAKHQKGKIRSPTETIKRAPASFIQKARTFRHSTIKPLPRFEFNPIHYFFNYNHTVIEDTINTCSPNYP